MTREQREIQRKLRIVEYAEKIGDVSKTCRYFGSARARGYGAHSGSAAGSGLAITAAQASLCRP